LKWRSLLQSTRMWFRSDFAQYITRLSVVRQTVQNELTRVEKRCMEMESHQRQLYRKMLGTDGDEAAAGKHEVSKRGA